MKRLFRTGLLSVVLTVTCYESVTAQKKPVYKDATVPTALRVKDLLGRMNLEEKVGQVSVLLGWDMYSKTGSTITVSDQFKKALAEQHTGMLWATLRADPWTRKTLLTGLTPALAAKATNAIQKYSIENSRLNIPMLLAEECPHGHMAIGTTVFPTSIGQSSTWNPDLIQEMANAIALEARLQGAHIGYGPVLDLAREPRWSRVEETYGEDPVLNSRMGEAMVKGFQGNNLKSGMNIAATLKHFTAYGVPEGGHNGGSVAVGARELFQSYLPPFKAAVKAGAQSVMTAYNSIDGIPCSANHFLLTDVLRKQWGFNGFVVSDLGSISGLVSNHHVAANPTQGAAMAINAGLDADLSGYGYGPALLDAVRKGQVEQSVLDTAVARVLRIKFEMGLFENPYVNVQKAAKTVRNEAHVALARKVAGASLVLLKNRNNVLPLSHKLKKIAVIGPNADNIYNQLGDYTAPQDENAVVTVLEGIKAQVGKGVQVDYAKGCAIRDTASAGMTEAIELAKNAEVAVVVLGGSSARDFKTEYLNTGAAQVKVADAGVSDMESGEGFDRSTLDLMGRQMELLQRIVKTGTPVILVLIKGRPLNLNWAADHVDAIVDAWYPGQEGGNAIADVLFGAYNPSGKLPISIPKSVGQLPVYYNLKKPANHSYVEVDDRPLYPFGYGLSYTTFEYSNLNIAVSGAQDNLLVKVKLNVKNTGKRDGDEVTQLYLVDKVSSVVTPVKQLKKFKRFSLKSGAQKELEFELNAEDLKLFNQQMNWVLEPGDFTLMLGSSSDDVRLKGDFTVQ